MVSASMRINSCFSFWLSVFVYVLFIFKGFFHPSVLSGLCFFPCVVSLWGWQMWCGSATTASSSSSPPIHLCISLSLSLSLSSFSFCMSPVIYDRFSVCVSLQTLFRYLVISLISLSVYCPSSLVPTVFPTIFFKPWVFLSAPFFEERGQILNNSNGPPNCPFLFVCVCSNCFGLLILHLLLKTLCVNGKIICLHVSCVCVCVCVCVAALNIQRQVVCPVRSWCVCVYARVCMRLKRTYG